MIGAAGLVFFVTRPEQGTVEWHKREYLSAVDTLRHGTWEARLKRVYYKTTGKAGPTPTWGEAEKRSFERMRASQTTLIELGYFSQYRITLTNRIANALLNKFFD